MRRISQGCNMWESINIAKLILCQNRASIWYIDTIQELANVLVPHTADSMDWCSWLTWSEDIRAQSSLRQLPDCETLSISLPSRISSSFCALDSITLTPSSMSTCRTVCKMIFTILPKLQCATLPFHPGNYGFQAHFPHPEWCNW